MTRLQRDALISQVRIWDGSTPWLLTRYHDVRAVLRDPACSSNGDLPGYPHISAGAVAQQQRLKTFMDMDEPEHAAQRRPLIAEFTFRKVEALRPRIQRIAENLIGDLLAGPKPADLVEAVALPLPSLVICELLGVPYSDHAVFQQLSQAIISRHSSSVQAVAATEDLLNYLDGLVQAKRKTPSGDLVSRLAVGQFRTGAMTVEQIASTALLLLVAGHETTASMIALGTVVLLQHQQRLREIRDSKNPQFIASAVEELLRFLSIVQSGRRRVATRTIEVGGQLIRKGEGLIAATDLANRDETVFPDPHVLNFRREARPHLAFGYGIHQCLGQTLARVQLQVVCATLYRRIPTLRLALPAHQLDFRHDSVVYGVQELPVSW